MTDAKKRRLDKLARYIAASVLAFASGQTFEEVYYTTLSDPDEWLADDWYELAARVERAPAELLRANFNHVIPEDR